MARQRLTYKTYPVSTRVDPRGVFYGLIQGATTEPESSLREIMAYKKITAFDPKQVVNLVEDIIQGGMELTALDGRPRAISSMIKTFLGFDGSFPTEDARVTTQQLVSRVRLLKDLRVAVNMDNFTLVNEREAQLPFEILSAQDYRAAPDVSADVVYNNIPLLEGSSEYWRSFIKLTGRRLDEPARYELVWNVGADPERSVALSTYATATNPEYEEVGENDPTTFIGFYSAVLQIQWTDNPAENPNVYLPSLGSVFEIRAYNSEDAVIYSKPVTFAALPA